MLMLVMYLKQFLISKMQNTSIITVGRRGKEYFVPRKYDVLNSYMGFTERQSIKMLVKFMLKLWSILVKVTIEVYLVYTKFVSAISAIPQTIKLLPFTAPRVLR